MTFEIETKDAVFVKISTSTYGGLRFKEIDGIGIDIDDKKTVQAYAELYADQISIDRKTFTADEVLNLPGFSIVTVKDKQRCQRKISPPQNSTSSSKKSQKQ